MGIVPTWITVDPRTSPHRAWCAADCDSHATGVHRSPALAAGAEPGESTGVAVRLEEFADSPPVTMLGIQFTQDGETAEFQLPVRQAAELHRAVHQILTLPHRP